MHHVLLRAPLALALSAALGTTLTLGATTAQAQSQSPDATGPAQTTELKAVVVTGSLIRRVDIETASPVITLDRQNIVNTGKPTLGDVLQQLPTVQGNATNTQNNSTGGGSGGPSEESGSGAARVSLRGLGVKRTLMLIDGQRMANADLNMIPQNMIERVDVLSEGASTVYGSDAIGGVVNFILRKDYQGAEFSLNDGISSHGDSQRRGFNLTVGANGDKGHVTAGLDYNKYDEALATRRSFSAYQLYLSSGKIAPQGSSSTPTGRLQVPASIASRYGCTVNSLGTAFLTRTQQGNGTNLDDWRCYNRATDTFNYSAFNFLQTPQERTSGFVLGSYELTPNVTFFMNMFHNRTQASGQDAPTPIGLSTQWSVPASSPINPFGVTFSRLAIPGDPNSGFAFSTRLTGIGPRLHSYATNNTQINTGLRGNFGQSSWSWVANANYAYANRVQTNSGIVDQDQFAIAIANGLNIFDQASPAVVSELQPIANVIHSFKLIRSLKEAKFQANGELLDLPAGAMQLAVGTLYRKERMDYSLSFPTREDPLTGDCLTGGCGSASSGSGTVKEAFAETLIPLLSDVPFAHSLNVDLGVRTSDYSASGTSTNKKIAVEWRPIADLMVRGTVSQVFRAPDLNELYDGISTAGPIAVDPCAHLTAAQLAPHANGCQFVPVNWGGNPITQVTTQNSGAMRVGGKLKPEHGKSIDFGLVYSPSSIPGLSSTVDLWHIYLRDLVTPLAAQTLLNSCFANDASFNCSLIERYGNDTKTPGNILRLHTPFVNMGTLSTSGVDFTSNYRIPHFNLGGVDPGNFKVGLDATYTSTFKNNATPGEPGTRSVDYAGTLGQQFGNITRWRGTATFNWGKGNWNAQWHTRYIHRLTLLNADSVTGASKPLASVVYNDIQLGYAVPSIHTRFSFGVDNLMNRMPPLVYQTSLNANTDVATYNVIGRYYHARVTVDF